MITLIKIFQAFPFRGIHTSVSKSASVFMKRQKKVDPEVAKVREARKRRKLEREIVEIKKHSKKPKPIEEKSIDIVSAKNIDDRYRETVQLSEKEDDERTLAKKAYSRFQGKLMKADDRWIRLAILRQQKALKVLKCVNPSLYEAAIQPDLSLNIFEFEGPALSPPIDDYICPDGEYNKTTRNWL